MKKKLIALFSSIAIGSSILTTAVSTASAVTLVEKQDLADYTKSYTALNSLKDNVTILGNQALLQFDLMVQKSGCVISFDEVEWEVTGTADVTYDCGNLYNSVSYDENYNTGYCLINAHSAGTVHVKGTEINSETGSKLASIYFNLTVNEDGNFEETVTYNKPNEEIPEETTEPTEYVIYESEGWVTLNSLPDKTSYIAGHEKALNLTGLKVSLEYGYGKDGLDVIFDKVSPLDYPEAFDIDTSEFDISKAGTYNIYVTLTDEYRDRYRVPDHIIEFPVTVTKDIEKTLTGDANGDGDFNVEDVAVLQKWLSGKGTLENWKNVDFCEDGKINIFDLCAMRRNLIKIASPLSLSAKNLTENIKSNSVTGAEADNNFIIGQTNFALSLLQNTANEENTLISPYSAMLALAMTANGADNETKAEMEKVLGGISIDKLNEYLYTYRNSQQSSEKCKINTVNSIWYRDDEEHIKIFDSFLQKNADYYNTSAFKAPFDETTLQDINTWVKHNTNNMIPSLLDKIDNDAVMYLINALTFDAKWKKPYTEECQIETRNFTALDGTVSKAEMMNSDEYYYLEDENATGFLKYYEGDRYAFAALLPNENISITDYVAGLTPESLNDTLSNPKKTSVYTVIPKFSCNYDIDFAETLAKMGMPSAFNVNADFSKMADTKTGALYIGHVLHKTHIDVFEEGTKAAAVTAVTMEKATCAPIDKFVVLDRPFVYCILDTETSLPIFIGTLMSIPE